MANKMFKRSITADDVNPYIKGQNRADEQIEEKGNELWIIKIFSQ